MDAPPGPAEWIGTACAVSRAGLFDRRGTQGPPGTGPFRVSHGRGGNGFGIIAGHDEVISDMWNKAG